MPGRGIDLPELLTWTLGERSEFVPQLRARRPPPTEPPPPFAGPPAGGRAGGVAEIDADDRAHAPGAGERRGDGGQADA